MGFCEIPRQAPRARWLPHYVRRVDIFQRVQALGLPLGQYVVFGGGPLAAHGIRSTTDVDLFVTSALYERLKLAGWEEKDVQAPGEGRYLAQGIYDAACTWHYREYNPAPEELIAAADIIQGLPFAPLAEVLKWKRAFGRAKDLADIALIEEFMTITDRAFCHSRAHPAPDPRSPG